MIEILLEYFDYVVEYLCVLEPTLNGDGSTSFEYECGYYFNLVRKPFNPWEY